jgi:putative tricarboxylic transport membrane protein
LLPVALLVEPSTALSILTKIYGGSVYGRSIPAVLMDTPRAAAGIATTVNG